MNEPLQQQYVRDKLTLIRDDVRELQLRLSEQVEPTPDVALLVGLVTAVLTLLQLLVDGGNIDASHCGGRVQHRIGCSRDTVQS